MVYQQSQDIVYSLYRRCYLGNRLEKSKQKNVQTKLTERINNLSYYEQINE